MVVWFYFLKIKGDLHQGSKFNMGRVEEGGPPIPPSPGVLLLTEEQQEWPKLGKGGQRWAKKANQKQLKVTQKNRQWQPEVAKKIAKEPPIKLG